MSDQSPVRADTSLNLHLDQLREAQSLASIIRALDRCEHGRHVSDSCLACPGRESSGNKFLVPGQRIGTTLYGEPIVVPERWALRTEARYWLPEGSPSRESGKGPV